MLHIAPEREIEKRLSSQTNLQYVSGDINPGPCSVKMDITHMPFEDSSFDVIYCCHVLNMVRDDRAAIREIGRVLKPSGWALLQVPMSDTKTVEADDTPKERLRLFMDAAMFRAYGADVLNRFEREALSVRVLHASEVVSVREEERFAIAGEKLLVCTKREEFQCR